LDVADITVVNGQVKVNVALDAPVDAPRVADNPVRLSSASSSFVANSLDAVINRSWAGLEDAAGVGLPRVSSNTDRDWASAVDVARQLAIDSVLVVGIGGDGLVSIASAELADSSGGNVVRVVNVEINAVAVLDGVDVSIMRPATVAAVVVVSAGSALLNGEDVRVDFAVHSIERFDSLISTVSPARAALSLVLHGGDDA